MTPDPGQLDLLGGAAAARRQAARKPNHTHTIRDPGTVILTALDGQQIQVPRDGLVVGPGPEAPGRYVRPGEPPQPAPGTPLSPPRRAS